MTPKDHLKHRIQAIQEWAEPLTPQDRAGGFKGWHVAGRLPHCDTPGTRQFVTFRLADALPLSALSLEPGQPPSSTTDDALLRLDSLLDGALGRCDLANPGIAELVERSLWHHDGIRYRLVAWVIMPNHVHVVLEIWDTPLLRVVKSWKGYTATHANRVLGRAGTFWQRDYFDRYIRGDEHLQEVVRYVEMNPVKAGLVREPSEWRWGSARYRGKPGRLVPELTHPTANRVPGTG